jgi:SAM-dependent methyltransferase
LAGKRDFDIVDVGCGDKPFYPFFKSICRSYVGTDVLTGNPMVDVVCPAEALQLQDSCADVVLCLSVLEHVDDPGLAVKELFRILRPDGVVFASTHGCFPWHPFPQDHWRWTQTGLPILFSKSGGFRSVEIHATRGTMSGIFFLLAHYGHSWCLEKRHRHCFRGPMVSVANAVGRFLDNRTPSLKDLRRHVTAIPEFFVIARKEERHNAAR